MQSDEADQQLLQGLSSTCDELSTSTTRRNQELQSLAELLQSIKQLQDQATQVGLCQALATRHDHGLLLIPTATARVF